MQKEIQIHTELPSIDSNNCKNWGRATGKTGICGFSPGLTWQ